MNRQHLLTDECHDSEVCKRCHLVLIGAADHGDLLRKIFVWERVHVGVGVVALAKELFHSCAAQPRSCFRTRCVDTVPWGV
eukprot:3661293-Prymnesium_polylepis.1